MCGRFVLEQPITILGHNFGFEDRLNLAPRYNIAPTQDIFVVQNLTLKNKAEMIKWGLRAPTKHGERLIINARSETVSSLGLFKKAFSQARCLIPADGYYEWKAEGKQKLPYYITKKDTTIMAFAGLMVDEDSDLLNNRRGLIITTTSNDDLSHVHDRMPVIVPHDQWSAWLSTQTPAQTLLKMLRPLSSGQLELHRVATSINSARLETSSIPFL